jgi:hypothetical protein
LFYSCYLFRGGIIYEQSNGTEDNDPGNWREILTSKNYDLLTGGGTSHSIKSVWFLLG